MTIFRSARLETLLGTTISEATYSDVCRLVDNATPEDFDLDYKSTRYGERDKDKHELCADVAAFANAAGGLIVLGIEEDDSCAVAAPGIDLSDSNTQLNRIYQIVASGVAPLLQPQVRALPGPDGNTGFIIIAVPASPDSPHAVRIAGTGDKATLRFPRRNGTTTAYWSEAELAAAYRNRFAREREQGERLALYEQDLTEELETGRHVFVVVSLLPDRPGAMRIDAQAEADFRNEILGKRPMIAGLATIWRRTRVGPRRLSVSSSAKAATEATVVSELHADGGGTFAGMAGERSTAEIAPEGGSLIEDELLVLGVLSGLRMLGRHARDRAATAGNASLRATVYPVSAQAPAVLCHGREDEFEAAGERTVRSAPSGAAVADIDQLAQGGPGLVAAAYRLASDLVQTFGVAEAFQLTREGALRIRYWLADRQEVLEPWAQQVGVERVRAPLPYL